MTKVRRLPGLSIVLAVVVSLASACGEDDAPSRAEFAKNADGICADIEQEIKSLGRADVESPEDFSRIVAQLKSRVNEGVDRLSKLDRPEGDAGKTADQFIDALEGELRTQAIPALDEADAAVKAGDRAKLRAADKKLDALDKTPSDQFAKELGADKCAEA